MSKVGEYFRESDKLNGNDNVSEPTDEELKKIELEVESNLEDMKWEE